MGLLLQAARAGALRREYLLPLKQEVDNIPMKNL